MAVGPLDELSPDFSSWWWPITGAELCCRTRLWRLAAPQLCKVCCGRPANAICCFVQPLISVFPLLRGHIVNELSLASVPQDTTHYRAEWHERWLSGHSHSLTFSPARNIVSDISDILHHQIRNINLISVLLRIPICAIPGYTRHQHSCVSIFYNLHACWLT